jgi:phosphatidylserine/phosphatidylglycerophosphate/cardiolipin synthase-like enzyme
MFYTDGAIIEAFMDGVRHAENSIDMWCYCIDYTPLCVLMYRRIAEGVKGRFILDIGNFYSSSCTRQAERISDLYQAGIAAGQPEMLRVIKPKPSGFSSMHCKSTIIDGRTVFTGSPNMTHNGLENNKEHFFRMTQMNVVQRMADDFESLWQASEPVNDDMIERMNLKAVERVMNKASTGEERLKRSTSVRLNRTLDPELRRA